MKGMIIIMVAASLICVPLIAESYSADPQVVKVETVADRTFRFTAPVSGVWDTGDGGIYTGTAALHTFSVSGLHRVTFTSGGTAHTAAALVIDKEPVTTAATGVRYNYCPGIVSEVTTDCPGLFWSPGTMSLTGIPVSPGTYTVTADGQTFQLSVTIGAAQIDRSFAVETDGLTVKVTAASAGALGISYWWQIYRTDGSLVAEGISAEQTFVLNEPGDYIAKCTMRDSTLQSTVFSKQFTLTELPPEEEVKEKKNGGFEVPIWMWVIGGSVGVLLILRRFI